MWKIIMSLLLLCAFSFQAQNTLPLEWSKNPKHINPGGDFTVAEIAFDETSSTGNALPIKIGNFSNTANFNFAEDIENAVFEVAESEFDAYIAKYDESDTLLWVKKLNGTGTFTMQHIVVVDNFFYVLGTLSGTVDFNPTTAIANKSSAGNASLVIAKYDLNGFYVNAKVIDFDSSFEVQKFKTNGSLLAVVGEFSGNIDFGLSSNMGSFGGNDGFMALYNTNLSFQSATPIGGLGDDVASDMVFHNNHMYVSSVEQDILDPMCSADLPTEGAYTGQYQLNVLTSGQFGPLFEDGIVTLTGSGNNRNFITTNLYPIAGPFDPINFEMQLDRCGNIIIPKTNIFVGCSGNVQLASLNLNNSYNIYNDSTLTLEFYNDVDQSCGTPELTRIELTKVDTPVEDYNIDLSGNTPLPFIYNNYLKKYDLNGTLVLNTAIGSEVDLTGQGFDDSKHYLHTNLHVTNNNEIALLGAYTGNKSFGNNNTTEVPPFSAPLPPQRNSEDVISIFSGAYSDLPNTNYFPYWGQIPESTASMFNLNGDDMLQFNNLTYQGIQLENGTDIDVSNMEYLHFDVWTNENITQLETSLINNSNGVVTENAVLSPLNANGWTSIDIPITEYTSQGLSVSQIWQLKFEAKLSDWGLVGSATPNGWDGPDMEMHELAPNKYGLFADLTAGEFKFRFNEDWAINFGDNGANGSVEPDGANIAVTEAGRYYITLNLNTYKYTIEAANLSSQGAVFIDNIYFHQSAAAKPVKPNLVTASSKTPISKNANTASSGDFSLPQISGNPSLGYFLCKINPEDITLNNIDPLFIINILYNKPQPTFLSAYEAATNSLILLNKTETQNPMRFDYTRFDFSNYEMNREYYFYKFNVDDPNNLSVKPIYYNNSPTYELIVGGNEIFHLTNASYGYTDYDIRINSTNYIETSGYPIINHYSLDGDYVSTTIFNKGVRKIPSNYVLNDIDSQNNIYFITGNSSGLDINNDNAIDVPVNYSGKNSSISKYDFNGNLLWSNALTANFGSVEILKFKIDGNDDLLIFGEFEGEGYFDSSSNEIIASSLNNNNTIGYERNFFVAKYNSEGELLWLNRLINDIYFRSIGGQKLALDDNNNIYLHGRISKYADNDTVIDIDPRDDFAFYVNFPDDSSSSTFPLFVKYDTQGNIVFAKVGDPKLYRETTRSSIAINDNKLQFLFYKAMLDWDNETAAIVDLDLSLENEVIVDTSSKEVLVNYSLDGEYLSHHILSDKSNFYDIEANQSQSAFMSKPITDNNNNLFIIARHRNSFEYVNQPNDINYSKLFISKYDSNYNLIWEKNIGTAFGYHNNAVVHKSGKLVLNFSYRLNADLTNLESNLIFNSSEIINYGTGLLIIDEHGELWYHKNIVNSIRNHLSLTDEHLILSGNYGDSIYLENNSTPNHSNINIWEPYLAIFNVESVLNVPKNKFNSSCSVYPNPSKDIINIVVDHFKSATVHNIMGQKILDIQQQEIDLSGHESGIYLVKIKTTQGKTFVRKFIKN